jgi:hypothetical protein
MFGRRILVVAIAGALLLPAFAECLTPAAQDAQAMRCCAQLSCAPSHEKQACYATTAPAGGSQSAPEIRSSLVAPSVTTDIYRPAEELVLAAFASTSAADAPQHPPPNLYTLHLALLI